MTSLTTEDVGVAAVTSTELSVEHGRRLAAVLDEGIDIKDGTELPLLWHWVYFAPPVATSDLGHDGHPRMAPGGPTADLPRRMWAGGNVRQHAPLVFGRPATRRSRVAKADRKSGKSGDLLVVTVEHEIEQDGRVAIVEAQNLVYLAASSAQVPAPVPSGEVPAAPDGGWADVVTMDPVRLFRFSALTFNSHRIHYDLPYATGEEGYPGLVVHGPLTAILLSGSARQRLGVGAGFEFRATAPLFAGAPFTLVGTPGEGSVALEAVRVDGTTSMTATFTTATAASHA